MGKKLRQRSGAALILALMFFLLCACVGTMVVTAASANAGKTARMREEEQRYQAVKAAANTFAQLLKNSPYKAGYTEYSYQYSETYVADDGNSYTRIVSVTTALKGSIQSSSNNCFPGDSKVAGLLGNSIRNLYLQETRLSNGERLLSSVSNDKGGLKFVWSGSEVDDTGPGTYVLRFKLDGFPDVLLTLKINKGETGEAFNRYGMTIIATDESGGSKVVLYSKVTQTKSQSATITSGPGGSGTVDAPNTWETSYATVFSWENWEAKTDV